MFLQAGATALPSEFTNNQGSYDVSSIVNYSNHENALKLQENSTSLTSIRVTNGNIGNNGGFEIYVNVHYVDSNDIVFSLMPCKAAWNNYLHIYFYKNGNIKFHYTGDNYVTSNFTFQFGNWYKISYNLTGTHRNVYINNSLEFVETNSNAIEYIYIKAADNKPGVFYLDGFKVSNIGWDKISREKHFYYQIFDEYELSNEIRYVYSFNINFESDYFLIFNYNDSAYEIFNYEHYLSYMFQNRVKFYFYSEELQDGNINYSLDIDLEYFESDFYDLFTFDDILSHNVMLNSTKLVQNPFSINLLSNITLNIEIDVECFYSLAIIVSYNITEVVEE